MIAAWSPAATPSFTWPSPSFASSAAIAMSASSATTTPAPTATPLIADTTGFSQSMMFQTRSDISRSMWETRSWSPAIRSTMPRSPPAENAFPAPVITATRVAASADTSRQTRASSPCRTSSAALYFAGLSMVMSRTPSSRRSNRSWV